jgi:4-hydroxy-3-methylbut-2-enyl diphosphate reductase IspH
MLKPRGFCAGVVRAIDIVKIALETFRRADLRAQGDRA